MSVHKDITKHSSKQHSLVKEFMKLDESREQAIEEALTLCEAGKSFTTDRINHITQDINALARQGVVPQRKTVTEEMVREYANRR